MAGKRYFPEFCGGPRGVSGAGAEPRPGGGGGRLCPNEDALAWHCVRRCNLVDADGADKVAWKLNHAGSDLRDANDCADDCLAIDRDSKNGGAKDANGIDSSNSDGQSAAGRVFHATPDFGHTRKRSFAGRNCLYVFDGERVSSEIGQG